MRRTFLLLLIWVLLAGCARPAAGPGPSAPPTPAPGPEGGSRPSVPSAIAYEVLLDGKPLPAATTLGSAPVTIVIRFSAPMDRAATEQKLLDNGLLSGTKFSWVDDATVEALVPRGGAFAVNPGGAANRDGTAWAGFEKRMVYQPPLTTLTVYSLADILAGQHKPLLTLEFDGPITGWALAPDGRQLLIYPSDPLAPGQGPLVLDLVTGARTKLPAPAGVDYGFGGWLKDGRIALIGDRQLLVGGVGEMKVVTAEAPRGLFMRPSPDGREVAAWSGQQIHVINLVTGQTRSFAGPFRRGCQDCGVNVAWSPDGKQIAGADFDSDTGGDNPKIRILDSATGAPIRVIQGFSLYAWLPGGDLLATRRVEGEIQPVLLDAAGAFRRNAPPGAPSPDGRYMLVPPHGGPSYFLVPVGGGNPKPVPPGIYPQWLPDGRIISFRTQY